MDYNVFVRSGSTAGNGFGDVTGAELANDVANVVPIE